MNINELFYNFFWITFYIIFLIVFFWVLVLEIASWKRKTSEKKHAFDLTFLQIKLPTDNEIEIKAAEHMFSNIMGFKKGFWQKMFTGEYRISFEIVARSDGIGFYIVIPDEIAPFVEKHINAAYPSAEIDIVNPHEIWDRGEHTEIADLKLKGPAFYPIKVYEDLKNDSLSSITNSMSKLSEDEVLTVQYVLQPASNNWRTAGQSYISKVKQKSSSSETPVNIDTAFLDGIQKKISQPGFYTKIRVVSIAKDKIVAQGHIKNMQSAFEQFTDVQYNRFVKTKKPFGNNKKVIDDFIYRRIRVVDKMIPLLNIQLKRNVSILNITELATVFHFPNKEVGTPNIIWLTARKSQAPANIPTEGLYLGDSLFRSVKKQVYMKTEDRTRHFYIIGQTGTGKSQMMMFLALQDIKNGEGVAIIDPHGSDIDELLGKIPPERLDDVILFDAADTERPLGLNIMDAQTDEERHMAINAFIALLYKLYDPNHQGIMGPMLERTIRNVMLTAMVDPQSTLIDVMRLLIDRKYYLKFIDKIQDPLVKRFWTDEMANTPEARKNENMGYFVSKFDRFITDKLMRNLLGQPKSAFKFDEIMAQKKILLVDLAKGKIGEENSSFLGLLLVPKILSAALGRHKYLGKEEFPHFYLYVDEFQNFATSDFATILSEARKYKLNLTVAHQFVEQLAEDIKEAIFGNVGTMSIFRVGTKDAEFLEPYVQPTFTKADLSNLSVGNCYMKLLIDGHPSIPFSMNLDWNKISANKKDPSIANQIKENSRIKYGTPAAEVEEFIMSRIGINETKEEPSVEPGAQRPLPKLPF